MRLKNPDETKRRIKLERESAEFQNQNKKYDELRKKEYEAEFAQFLVEKEVKSAKKKYNVVRLNNLKKIVEKIVLIKMIQKKIRFAQTQFEKKKESTKKIELKKKVISELNSISCIKEKMKRHKILLK